MPAMRVMALDLAVTECRQPQRAVRAAMGSALTLVVEVDHLDLVVKRVNPQELLEQWAVVAQVDTSIQREAQVRQAL